MVCSDTIRTSQVGIVPPTCCCPSKAMDDLARRAATMGLAKPRRAREVPRRPGRDMAMTCEYRVVVIFLGVGGSECVA